MRVNKLIDWQIEKRNFDEKVISKYKISFSSSSSRVYTYRRPPKMNVSKKWKKSKYYDDLEESDKTRYVQKLTLNNNEILPDPYAISEGWSNDVSRLPDVAYPDIYNYLIETPSDFTKDKLKAYKSLEAYNFFISGHVHDVYICNLKNNFYCLKSQVLPSQRQGERATLYEVWVVLHHKGWLLCANCKCMAG